MDTRVERLKMKFVLISPKNRTAYNFRGDLIKEIVGMGYEVIVTGPDRTDEKRITELGARFVEIPLNKTGTSVKADLKYLKSLKKLFREEKPDVTLGYTIKPVIYGAIAEQMHEYAAALQVNYARCMSRGDTVAAELCRSQGLRSAMELFFLLRKEYPPYYKWTFRALTELDSQGSFSQIIQKLADAQISRESWAGVRYHPDRINYADSIVSLAEEAAALLEGMLLEGGLIRERKRYLETHVNEVLLW